MKKLCNLLSLFFAFIFIISTPVTARAVSPASSSNHIQDAVNAIKASNPTAEVEIIDGVIHVYIASPSANTYLDEINRSTLGSVASSIYAPNGGSWRNFTPPSYMIQPGSGYTLPYCVTFLPGDKADALYISMTTTGLWSFLKDNPLSSLGAETVGTKILNKFGISLSTSQIVFLYSASCIYLYNTVNVNSLARAKSETAAGKVRIDYTTINDVPTNYYYSWSGNYVTDSPWQEFSPTFYKDVYYE